MIWISVNGKAINISLAGNLLPSNPCGCHWNQYNAKLDTKDKKINFLNIPNWLFDFFFLFDQKILLKEVLSISSYRRHKRKSSCRCMIFQKFRSALPIFFLSLLTVASPIGHFPEEKPFETEYTNSFKFAILNEFMTWFIDLKPTII